MDRAHLPPRQGWRVGKPGRPSRIFRPWMDEKRSTGVAFLGATFLWPSKERWLARPGGGRKKDRDAGLPKALDPGLRRDDERGNRCAAPGPPPSALRASSPASGERNNHNSTTSNCSCP